MCSVGVVWWLRCRLQPCVIGWLRHFVPQFLRFSMIGKTGKRIVQVVPLYLFLHFTPGVSLNLV